MSIFETLAEEHRKILDLLELVDRTPEDWAAQKLELVSQLREELQSHLRTEEDVLYSLLWSDPSGKIDIGDADQEHHALDLLMEEIEGVPVTSRQWKTKFAVLREILEEHFRHEEEVLFAEGERTYAEQTGRRLGDLLMGGDSALAFGGRIARRA